MHARSRAVCSLLDHAALVALLSALLVVRAVLCAAARLARGLVPAAPQQEAYYELLRMAGLGYRVRVGRNTSAPAAAGGRSRTTSCCARAPP